jgi:hypothetical protein
MKLLEQILNEMGADESKAYTIIPHYGAYLKSVKCITLYSTEKITVQIGKNYLNLVGENLTVGKYFQQDLLILGEVRGTQFE